MEDKKEWKTEEKSDIEIRDLSVTFQDGGEMIHAMEDVSAYFPSGRPGWKEAVCIKGWICTGCRKKRCRRSVEKRSP